MPHGLWALGCFCGHWSHLKALAVLGALEQARCAGSARGLGAAEAEAVGLLSLTLMAQEGSWSLHGAGMGHAWLELAPRRLGGCGRVKASGWQGVAWGVGGPFLGGQEEPVLGSTSIRPKRNMGLNLWPSHQFKSGK